MLPCCATLTGMRGASSLIMLPEPVEHDGAVLSIVLNDVVENFKAAAVVSIENEQHLQHEAPMRQQLRLRAGVDGGSDDDEEQSTTPQTMLDDDTAHARTRSSSRQRNRTHARTRAPHTLPHMHKDSWDRCALRDAAGSTTPTRFGCGIETVAGGAPGPRRRKVTNRTTCTTHKDGLRSRWQGIDGWSYLQGVVEELF